MRTVAEFIHRTLSGENPEEVRAEVKTFARQFPMP